MSQDADDVPPGFYRVPARCQCGAEFTTLSVRPASPGEVRDRRCDLCVTQADMAERIRAAAAHATAQLTQPARRRASDR